MTRSYTDRKTPANPDTSSLRCEIFLQPIAVRRDATALLLQKCRTAARVSRASFQPGTFLHNQLRAHSKGSPDVLRQEVFREEPTLTHFAFGQLLNWLDDGVNSHGERYIEIRRRLVAYFERRNRPDPDSLADETLNRIARTLQVEGVIATRPPARYCYVVARFVLLEDYRRVRKHVRLRETAVNPGSGPRPVAIVTGEDAALRRERRLNCLDRCLEALRPEQRELVVDYYRDAKRQKLDRRRALASRLGITMNALGIRVFRIRDGLMACIERCGAQCAPDLSER